MAYCCELDAEGIDVLQHGYTPPQRDTDTGTDRTAHAATDALVLAHPPGAFAAMCRASEEPGSIAICVWYT